MPDQARLVVLYAVSIEALKARKAATGVIRRARGAAMHSFARMHRRFSDAGSTRSRRDAGAGVAQHGYQRWLPPLPQRGLVPRRPGRFGSIRSVAFKGNPENVPPDMKTESWTAALATRGISWWPDVPKNTDGSDQRWHDFAEVDAAICMRNPAKVLDIERKPATRLVNAWRAGCIPLAHPEPAYRELGTDETDLFFVKDGPYVSRCSIASVTTRSSCTESRIRSGCGERTTASRSFSPSGEMRLSGRCPLLSARACTCGHERDSLLALR